MRKLIFVFVLILCLPFCLFACGKEEKLTTYAIVAEFDGERTLNADMSVNYVNTSDNALAEICFFLYPNTFKSQAVSDAYFEKAYLHGESFGEIVINSVKVGGKDAEFSSTDEILTVKLEKEIFPAESASIDINFTLTLAEIRHRLGANDNAVNFGNFFPIACVYEDGVGFVKNKFSTNGDPFYSEVSNFDVSISYPKEFVLASTGNLLEESESGETKTSKCSADKVRDFCFVLSKNFQVVSAKAGDVEVKYYFYDDQNAQDRLETSVKAVETFAEMFGKYPYQQLSVVKTGFCYGGMEYPNLVMIADDLASTETQDYVIVHEIAHQWWYGLVGNNEFDSAWVDEGLTEYSTALFYEKNSEYGMDYVQITQNARKDYQEFVRVYTDIRGELDESMNRKLTEFRTEPEYVNCTYTKGLLMFDCLRSLLGDRKFFKCLRDYFDNYCYQNSSPERMAESFSKSSHTKLGKIFDSWTSGKVKVGA